MASGLLSPGAKCCCPRPSRRTTTRRSALSAHARKRLTEEVTVVYRGPLGLEEGAVIGKRLQPVFMEQVYRDAQLNVWVLRSSKGIYLLPLERWQAFRSRLSGWSGDLGQSTGRAHGRGPFPGRGPLPPGRRMHTRPCSSRSTARQDHRRFRLDLGPPTWSTPACRSGS